MGSGMLGGMLWTDACDNITFPELRLQAVDISDGNM